MPAKDPSADALVLLAWAGIEWQRGPIPTGLSIIRQYAQRVGAWQSPRLPELRDVEASSVWDRELSESERDRKWCHLIDKHAAYLGACSSLELGISHPEWVRRPIFDRRLPGYWRVEVDAAPWPLVLPDPLGRDVQRRKTRQWFTTPTVELAVQEGIELEIAEAWVWPIHRRVLRPFYERCRDARRALEAILARNPPERHRVAAMAALVALKAIYAATLGGGLARSKDRLKRQHPPPWYRPDWRHHVIAKARANMLRNLAEWAARGVYVAAIYNDGCYVLSDDPAPSISPDRTLGGYSLKASWPAASMIGRNGRVLPSLAWGEDRG